MVSAILLPTHSAAHGLGAAGMGRGVGFSGNFGRGPNRARFGRKRNGFGWSRGVSYFGECVDMGWDCDWYQNSSDYGYPANYGEGYPSGLNIIMTPFQQTPVEPPPPRLRRPRQSNPKCASIAGRAPATIRARH